MNDSVGTKELTRLVKSGWQLRAWVAIACAIGTLVLPAPGAAQSFDFDTGNAPFEVIIPTVIPVILEDVSPTASDPSLIFRITTLATNAWFDAIAPYHPTAVGVYSRFAERQTDPTNRNKNIAIFYASFQVLNSLFPHRRAQWEAMLAGVGLDPLDASVDPTSPIGIGNLAGHNVIASRAHDGMNQLGDEGDCRYNCEPYADYTGYRPVNTAYRLLFPSRWQPALVSQGNGLFHIQQFVTPHLGYTEPYSYRNPDRFRTSYPVASQAWNYAAYREQADEVLRVSANLTDQQKMMAELFDQKFDSVFSAVAFTVFSRGLTLEESVVIEFLTNMASFDTAIAIWNDKRRYDSVRPFSAIEFVYGDSPVTAWGGPGNGTVHDLPASQWMSYLKVGNHPEYPSGSASFCAAHAEVMRRLLGSDTLGFSVAVPAGSSKIEPGITPATDLVLSWDTWTDLENDCGQSRLWGGVHFSASIPAGIEVGHRIGERAHAFVQAHLSGNARPNTRRRSSAPSR